MTKDNMGKKKKIIALVITIAVLIILVLLLVVFRRSEKTEEVTEEAEAGEVAESEDTEDTEDTEDSVVAEAEEVNIDGGIDGEEIEDTEEEATTESSKNSSTSNSSSSGSSSKSSSGSGSSSSSSSKSSSSSGSSSSGSTSSSSSSSSSSGSSSSSSGNTSNKSSSSSSSSKSSSSSGSSSSGSSSSSSSCSHNMVETGSKESNGYYTISSYKQYSGHSKICYYCLCGKYFLTQSELQAHQRDEYAKAIADYEYYIEQLNAGNDLFASHAGDYEKTTQYDNIAYAKVGIWYHSTVTTTYTCSKCGYSYEKTDTKDGDITTITIDPCASQSEAKTYIKNNYGTVK